jgi:hypothetical protein
VVDQVWDRGPPVTQERGAGGQVGTSSNPIAIDASNDCRITYSPAGTNAAAITLTLGVRGGQGSNPTRVIAPGMSTIVCGSAYNSVYAGQTNAALVYEIGPHGSFFPDLSGGAFAIRGQTTQIATAALAPTTVATATGLTAGASGNNSVPAGAMVYYSLSAYAVSTSVEALGYVCIVGHTSGTMYVVQFPLGGISGAFPMTNTPEKLDISYANAFAGSLAVAGVYWAVSP